MTMQYAVNNLFQFKLSRTIIRLDGEAPIYLFKLNDCSDYEMINYQHKHNH